MQEEQTMETEYALRRGEWEMRKLKKPKTRDKFDETFIFHS